METNTAEKRAAMLEATTWKSHVNATILRVHSQFGSSSLEASLVLPADKDRFGGAER